MLPRSDFLPTTHTTTCVGGVALRFYTLPIGEGTNVHHIANRFWFVNHITGYTCYLHLVATNSDLFARLCFD